MLLLGIAMIVTSFMYSRQARSLVAEASSESDQEIRDALLKAAATRRRLGMFQVSLGGLLIAGSIFIFASL